MKNTKLVIQLTVSLPKSDAVIKRLQALAARGDKPAKVVAVINQLGRFTGLVKNVPVKVSACHAESAVPKYVTVKLALYDKPAPAAKEKSVKPAKKTAKVLALAAPKVIRVKRVKPEQVAVPIVPAAPVVPAVPTTALPGVATTP